MAAALVEPGWIVLPRFLGADAATALRGEIDARHLDGGLRRARTGRNGREAVRRSVRGDLIAWLDPDGLADTSALAAWHGRMQLLGAALGDALRLPVAGFDGHMTIHPPGSRYQVHVDAPTGASRRLLSAICYLNPRWSAADGGCLRLFTRPGAPPTEGAAFVDVEPHEGTLVLFRSADFWHEVRPTTGERLSLTGWFLSRSRSPGPAHVARPRGPG